MVDQQQDKETKDIEGVLNNSGLFKRKYCYYRNVKKAPLYVEPNICINDCSNERLIEVCKINGSKVLLVYYFTKETHIYLAAKEEAKLVEILPDCL